MFLLRCRLTLRSVKYCMLRKLIFSGSLSTHRTNALTISYSSKNCNKHLPSSSSYPISRSNLKTGFVKYCKFLSLLSWSTSLYTASDLEKEVLTNSKTQGKVQNFILEMSLFQAGMEYNNNYLLTAVNMSKEDN